MNARRYQARVDAAAGGCLALVAICFRLFVLALFAPLAWGLWRDGHALGALALLGFAGFVISTFAPGAHD